jgi:hypothetical protein
LSASVPPSREPLEGGEVGAGREVPASPGEHDRAQRAVLGSGGEVAVQAVRERRRQRVGPLRVVEGEDKDRAVAPREDELAHGPIVEE